MRPRTKGDFQRLGAKKRGGRSPAACRKLHMARNKERFDRTERERLESLPFAERVQRRCVAVPLGAAGDRFDDLAREMHPRKKNWDGVLPSTTESTWSIEEKNNGRYSSRCTYTHWTYRVHVKSRAFIGANGVLYLWFCGEKTRKITAPHGYRWDQDRNGVKLVNRRGDDYHPTAHDLLTMGPRKLAAILRENAATRRAIEREKKQTEKQRLAAIRRAEREGATVCLADSLRAGNCRAGSVQWARRHKLDPRDHIKPSELLDRANGDASRVAIVVTVALRRHREEMKRGYANLADHR